MDVVVANDGPTTIVAPSGDIDGRSALAFQEVVAVNVTEGSRVLLDLSGVPLMTSAGLRVLLLVYRQATVSNGRVLLCGLNSDIRGSMSATGFLSFFTVYPTREEALAALE